MTHDQTKITGKQLMFTIACFVQSSALLSSFISAITKQDTWIAVILGFLLVLPIIWVYSSIMTRYSSKNLIEILEDVYGPIIGKVFGALYVFFFFLVTSFNVSDFGALSKLTMLSKTPLMVLTGMCIMVAAYGIGYGLKVITRLGKLFTILSFTITTLSVILLFTHMDLQNFLPMLKEPFISYVQGTHIITTIPFAELVIVLMLIPNIKTNMRKKEITRSLFLGYTLGAITVFVTVFRDIAVLGNTFEIFSMSSFVTYRLISIGEIFSRMEILFSSILILLLYFKIALLYYVTVIAFVSLVKIKSYKKIILVFGSLIVVFARTLVQDPFMHAISSRNAFPLLWTIPEMIIPVITLIVIKVRKKGQVEVEMEST